MFLAQRSSLPWIYGVDTGRQSEDGLHHRTRQFTTMPFRLVQHPCHLRQASLYECVVYFDDLLVHGTSFESAFENLKEVLGRIQRVGFKLHPEICSFMQKDVIFLVHRVSQAGIMTKTDKVTAVREWITPENIHHLQSFVGLASYYRHFIAGFATVATPLYHLLRKDTPFERGPDQETAFNVLKQDLCQDPVCMAPDLGKLFIPEGERVVAYYL